jgi:hypothetical protein
MLSHFVTDNEAFEEVATEAFEKLNQANM